MFCTNCGKQLEPNSTFCTNCGKQIDTSNVTSEIIQPQINQEDKIKKAKIESTISLICFLILAGIIGSTFLPVRIRFYALYEAIIPCHIASIVLMIMARINDKKNKLGIIMMILHILTVVGAIIMIILVIQALSSLGDIG